MSNSVLPRGHPNSTSENALSLLVPKTFEAIKIGTEILRYNDAKLDWTPVNLSTSSKPDDLRRTFDDFVLFKDILILFKRGKDSEALSRLENLKKDNTEQAPGARDTSCSSEEDSSAEESLPSSSSEDSASELSAYESCSQGSTEYPSYDEESDDEENKDQSVAKNAMDKAASEADNSSVSLSEDGSDTDTSDDSRERAILTHQQFVAQLYADDHSSDDERQVAYYSSDGDDSFVYARPIFPDASKPTQGPGGAFKCSIGVFSLKSNPPSRLFHYEQHVPVMLYDSPPAIHPTRPLVVWPIACGDILFANYEENRYFIRQSRATSIFSKMDPSNWPYI